MRVALLIAACLVAAACSSDGPESPAQDPAPKAQGIDPTSGLIKAEGWELVAANCVACHSAKQFLRQRGTKQTWQDVIDWMQEKQGLWQFPDGVEDKIVSYLATNYGPEGEWRRAPLPATQMPPNPYASGIREQVEELRQRGELPTGPGGGR